jgi:hypothetical protein
LQTSVGDWIRDKFWRISLVEERTEGSRFVDPEKAENRELLVRKNLGFYR